MKPEHAANAMRKFGQAINNEAVKLIRRELHAARNEAIRGYQSRGVLRRIFGAKVSGLRTLVKRLRVTKKGGKIICGIRSVGLAALAEKGGQTRAHQIAHGFGRSGSVPHPGGPVAANPQLVPAMRKAEPRVRAGLRLIAEPARKAAGL